MGLISSVNNLNYTLEEEKKNKKLEQIKRQKERLQKENLARYKKDLEHYIKETFDRYFKIAGTSYKYEFYNRKRKKEILNIFFDTIEIQKNGFTIVPFKSELEEHFYNKYNTILNKCYKEQQQQEEYNTIVEYKKIQEEEEQQQIHKSNTTNTFLAILIWILKISLCIVFFPIIFLLFILFATIKNMK